MCQIDEQRDQECALKRINVKKSVDSKIKYFRRVRVQTENTSGTWDENKIYFKYMPKKCRKDCLYEGRCSFNTQKGNKMQERLKTEYVA